MQYRPSQLAACACIIGINIYEEGVGNKKFFKDLKKTSSIGSLKELNTQIWNNPLVVTASGYSIDALKECLIELCTFMSQSLAPDRLKGFNVGAVKSVVPFDQIPACVSLDAFEQSNQY